MGQKIAAILLGQHGPQAFEAMQCHSWALASLGHMEQATLAGVSDQEVPSLSCAHAKLLASCVLPLSHLAIGPPGLLHGPSLL